MPKKVVEVYTVDALSFSEAEERIMEEMSSYVSGEIEIADLKIAPYKRYSLPTTTLPTSGTRQSSPLSPSTRRLTRKRKHQCSIS